MLGQVGNDNEGKLYINYLQENNIDTSCIQILEDQCTGQAYILLNKNDGENSIIIVGGANQAYQVDPNTQSGLRLEWE
jgi:ribokinase